MTTHIRSRFLTIIIILLVCALTLSAGVNAARAVARSFDGAVTAAPAVLAPAARGAAEAREAALQTTTTLTVTKRDELVDDADGSGAAGAGDTLRYTIVVTNVAGVDAEDVVIEDALDAGLTLQGEVLVSPIAADDRYVVLGNTFIMLDDSVGVLSNDIDPDGGVVTATVVTAGATTSGGDIALDADGSLRYDPPVGFSGTDSFEYSIVDDDGLVATGTIEFEVGPVIWYVDDSANDGGDGRLSAPLNDLAEAEDEAGEGDVIFLYEGAYSHALTLEDEQQLVGQGVELASGLGLTAPLGSILPARTISPTLTGSITAAEDNGIYGLSLANGGGTALSATNFATLKVRAVSLEGNGRALDLSNGALDAEFLSISSQNSTSQGIKLANVSGTLNILAGEVEGAAVAGVEISNSSATMNYPGDITVVNSNAYAANLTGNSGATIVLEGEISSTNGSRGIYLSGNGGSTITFGGALTLVTGSNLAFSATGGGTVVAPDADNTVVTSGAQAIRIENTTIGAGGVRFRSISAQNSDKGIVLNNAGSGGFQVTGAGSDDGTGGTIQDIRLRAIEITNTDNVSFANMTLTNANTVDSGAGGGGCHALSTSGCNAALYLSQVSSATFENVDIDGTIEEQGINGVDVEGFNLRNSSIEGCGNAVDEGCLKMRNLTGSVTLENVTLSFAAEKTVEIVNNEGSLVLNVTGSTFSDTQSSANGADGFEVGLSGTAEASITIDNSSFLRNRTVGIQVYVEGSSMASVDVTNSSFDADAGVGRGLDLAAAGSGSLAFNIVGNPLIHSRGGTAINVAAFDSSTIQGRINGNSDIQTGGAATSGSGIAVQVNDAASGVLEIDTNTISNIGFDSGIYLRARPDLMTGAAGRLDATVTDNHVTLVPHVDALYDIELLAQGSNIVCSNVRDNTASDNGLASFRVRESSGGTLLLQDFTVSAANTWAALNNSGATVSESPAGSASAGSCTAPSHPTVAAADPSHVQLQPAKVSQVDAPMGLAAPAGDDKPVATQPVTAQAARLASNPLLQTTADITVGPFDLPAGKSVTVQFEAIIDDPFPAGAPQVENQARVSGANFTSVWSDDPDTATAADATITALDVAYDLALSKSDGGVRAEPGDTVVYTLSFSNDGNQHVAGVALSETVPAHATFNAAASSAGWVCADGGAAGAECTLAIGVVNAGAAVASRDFAVDVASALPSGVEQMENTAIIDGDSSGYSDGQPADNEATDTTPLDAQPDLSLTKAAGDDSAAPGETIPYTLSYANNGNQGAAGVVIEEIVPQHTTFDTGASSVGWSCSPDNGAGSVCVLVVGMVPAGGSGSAMFAVTVDNPVSAGVALIENSASIAGDGSDGDEPDETDNEATITTGLIAAPDLALEKDDGGATPGSGDTVVYTLTLRNRGNQGATGVVVTETVPVHTSFNAGASDAGWSCLPDNSAGSECQLALGAELAGGDEVDLAFAVDVVDSIAAGVTEISNQAQASGDEAGRVVSDDPDTGTVGDATITALDVRADLAITKSDGQTVAVPGEPLTYTITISNLGPDAVDGATVSDSLPAALPGASWQCEANAHAACGAAAGTGDINEAVQLQAGGAVTYTLQATILADASGIVMNEASVTVPAGVIDPDLSNNVARDEDTALAPEVELTLTVDESQDPVVAGSSGGNLQYTVTVTNHGPSLASGVVVQNNLTFPGGVTFDGATFDGGNGSFSAGGWTVNELEPGYSESLVLTLTAGAGAAAGIDVISNEAEILSANETIVNGGDSAMATTSVARSVDVRLEASATPSMVTAGSGAGNLTLVITATNMGPSAASGLVAGSALVLPGGVTVDSVTPSGTNTWDVSGDWTIGDLAPGDSETLTVVVTVGPDALPGTDSVILSASVEQVNEADSDSANDRATAQSSVVTAADLVVTLSDSHDPVIAGSILTYTVQVTNNGPSHASDVRVEATLDGALTAVESDGCAEDPNAAALCSLGTVEAGATAAFTITVMVDGAATGSISSSVAASSTAVEASPGDETANESTAVDSAADLSLHVSAQPDPALAGHVITYTVTVTNSGPSRAINTFVNNSLPPELTFQSTDCGTVLGGDLDGGHTISCQVIANIDANISSVVETTWIAGSATSDPDSTNDSFIHRAAVIDNQFTIGDVQLAEGNGGHTAFTFTITRTTNAVASAVDVEAVADTAQAGEDFVALATTVDFAAGGAFTQSVTVDVVADEMVELDETFLVQLSNAQNGSISDGEAVGIVLNDDSASVILSDAQWVEGDSGSTTMVVTATLSAAVDSGVTVDFVTVNGTAEDESGDGDYAAAGGALTFDGDAGEQALITIQINGDEVMEADESFLVRLSNLTVHGRDVTLARSEATATILNDDESVIGFDPGAYVIAEDGGLLTVSVTLNVPAAFTVTVDYASSDGTASAGEDYTAISGTLTFAPRETLRTIMLPLNDDALDEDDETLEIWLSHAPAGTLDPATNPATVAIIDNDGEPTVGFSAFEFTAAESEASAVISVALSHESGRDVSVRVSSSDGTAVEGDDYQATDELLTIAAGQRTATFTVPLIDDGLEEGEETVLLWLSDATNATVGAVATATLRIADDDETPGYIYFFPLSVKQATMPSSESLFSTEPGGGKVVAVAERSLPMALKRRYGGAFTH